MRGLALACLVFLTLSAKIPNAYGQNTVSWSSKALTPDILQGTSNVSSISFRATASLGSIDVVPVPALASFVETFPSHFDSIEANKNYNLTVLISIPATTAAGVYEGTLQMRRGTTPSSLIPLPLPITIQVNALPPLPEGISGPLITSLPPTAAVVGKPTRYQIGASSADPASLVFSLSTAPSGMTVDAKTGLVKWTPGSDQVGDQPITVVAQDSQGDASQSFALSVFGMRSVASALVSASVGGVITVNDPTSTINGLSIDIPAAALSSDTTIAVSELIPSPTLGGTPHFLLKGFSIDPEGTSLAAGATIHVPYDVNEFATTQGIALEDFLGVYSVETLTGNLQNLDTFVVDKVSHVLTGTVPHFSIYLGTNLAELCPPPTNQSSCPNQYAPSGPSSKLPAVLVHGFLLNTSCGALGNELYWQQLPYLLGNLDSGNSGRIDAWRFDWDSGCTSFEKSAGNLDTALFRVEQMTAAVQGGQPNVNLVAHSFGGILIRTYLENKAIPGPLPYRDDVNRVMTLGTPHTGIGGTFTKFSNIFVAEVCAKYRITCFEAGTGIASASTSTPKPGDFLNLLNGLPLPPLRSSLTSQYDITIGERTSCTLIFCSLQPDDGFITTGGADLCQLAVGYCNSGSVQEEINSNGMPTSTGLCHSKALFPVLCQPVVNTAMTEFQNTSHPLWDKICNFLGCTSSQLSPVTTLPATSVTSTSAVLNGNINSNGTAGCAVFQIGTDPNGINGTSASFAVAASNTTQTFSTTLTLSSNTTYYYQMAFLSGPSCNGVPQRGNTVSFQTLP